MNSDTIASPANLEFRRPVTAMICAGIGLVLVYIMHKLLPDHLARIILDRGGLIYPFSVQNAMWIVFCIGLGEIAIRVQVGNFELSQLRQRYLPEDSRTMLQSEDLVPVYRRIRSDGTNQKSFLARLIERSILQFQASRSVEQVSSLMHSGVDMYIHEIDLRYNLLRYLTWLIPSLGFIGTVVGIGNALGYAGEPGHFNDPKLLTEVTSRLSVSFNGTLVALVLAAALAFLTNIAQSREEGALNRAGQYCLDNLINRLYAR